MTHEKLNEHIASHKTISNCPFLLSCIRSKCSVYILQQKYYNLQVKHQCETERQKTFKCHITKVTIIKTKINKTLSKKEREMMKYCWPIKFKREIFNMQSAYDISYKTAGHKRHSIET